MSCQMTPLFCCMICRIVKMPDWKVNNERFGEKLGSCCLTDNTHFTIGDHSDKVSSHYLKMEDSVGELS